MKTAKQKAIEAAYVEHWDKVKDYVDENGFCHKRKKIMFEQVKKDLDIVYDHPNYVYPFRPKSLQGIETNNGWQRIESEDDLPESCNCRFILIDGTEFIGIYANDFKSFKSHNTIIFNWKEITHYKPITPELKPIW